jgi:RNA polymerase sigma factor (sigma-70 family)
MRIDLRLREKFHIFCEMSQEKPDSYVSPETNMTSGSPPDMVQTQEQFIEWALKEYERPLIGYAQGFVHDWERARDVVQDTFIRLCQQDVAKVRDGVKTWLFTVCRNRALDVLRKDSRLVEMDEKKLLKIPGNTVSAATLLEKEEVHNRLDAYLQRLTPNQREVIVLKFQQGLSYEEISRVTGLTPGNVGFLLHHALKRLREWIPREWANQQDES